MKQNNIDYKKYVFSKKELVINIGIGLLLDIIVSFIFYRSIIAFLLFLPGIIIFLKIRKKYLLEKRLRIFNNQFKDAIQSLSASLSTGYSIENSIKECTKDMKNFYGEDSYIFIELKNIIRQINLNIPIEKVFNELGERTNLEDIIIFASIIQIAKKGGGNLISIIKSTITTITEKNEIRKDIYTAISSKRFEQKIMNLVPIFIILYVDFSSPGLISKLYGNLFGVLIMTVCLFLYLGAYYISHRITSIEV